MANKRLPRPRDPIQLGKLTLDIFIGKIEDRAVDAPPDPTKNPAAVALGKLGGPKGGAARAAKLTPEQRQEIAKKAAAKRWGDKRR
jgi:hypothetical protein